MRRTFWAGLAIAGSIALANIPAAAKKATETAAPMIYKFRVTLTDKKGTPYTTDRPEKFLSQKAIERRQRMQLRVDEHDLPITPAYLNELRRHGRLVTQSKWNNTAVIELTDTNQLAAVRQLPFVKNVCQVWKGRSSIATPDTPDRHAELADSLPLTGKFYGIGRRQIDQIGGIHLHQAGLRGDGVTIAVIDGGFRNADCIQALHDVKILGTRNFVHPGLTVFDGEKHGMCVLSCIATNRPSSFVGTAPDAFFYLLVSEDGASEHKVEEDYWCAAVEYADSVGCDVVTSSLGYTLYEDPVERFDYDELDGRTHINSRSASLAASRGMLLLNSAGNEGNGRWKKICVPADATDMLTVGAVDAQGRNTLFSSLGNTADGRIKPDVMAMGEGAVVLDSNGKLTKLNGTSFSTPILCGLVACLRQAYPNVRPEMIYKAVHQSATRANKPDNVYGYGIPDMWKAYELLQQWTR